MASDWAKRKLWYLKVCLLALEFKKPAIITKMFGDAKRYQLGTYFGREVVQRLASAGADVALLTEICHALLAQRGAGDKGVQAAYYELVHVVRRVRGAADALQLHREVSSKGVTVSPGFGKYLAKLSAKPEPAPGEKKAAAAAAAAVKTKQQRMPTMAAAQA